MHADDATATPHLSPQPGIPRRLIGVLFTAISRIAPGLKPRVQNGLIRAAYTLVSAVDKRVDSTFLNFGYAPLASGHGDIRLEPEDEPDRYLIQLYHRVAAARALRGNDVLEIGCGRGGGASFVMRYLEPSSMTALDFAPSAIRFCRRRHRLEGLTFLEGNAESLPFPANSFDAAVNVESSHTYPFFDRFLQEVARVLRPGGHFLFADMRPNDKVAALRDELARALAIVEEENITANVVRALELDSPRRNRGIDDLPRLMRSAVRNVSGVTGTPMFEALSRGNLQYLRFVLQKRSQ